MLITETKLLPWFPTVRSHASRYVNELVIPQTLPTYIIRS
jgi:hypothetical protein